MTATSRTFAAWRALYRICREYTSWPDGFEPARQVLLAGYDPTAPPPAEVVVIMAEAEEDQGWRTMGQRARDSDVRTSIYIETARDSRATAEQATERLELFVTALEELIRDTVIPANRPAELAATFVWWEVARVLSDVAPLKGGDGYGGRATVTIHLKSRI